MVLCASAAISKAERMSSLSPDLSLGLRERSRARYSRRMSFFSWSSVRLYLGIAATVSISIPYEFTKKSLVLHAFLRYRPVGASLMMMLGYKGLYQGSIFCGCGEIGRRTRLRIWRRKACQ